MTVKLPDEREDLSGRAILSERYHLMERLGSGAFGSVYRAEEQALGLPLRTVAVKITHRRQLTASRAEEVLREARILARIASTCRLPDARKHLIHVYGMGTCPEIDGRGYLALEFVPGVRLLRHITSFAGGTPMRTARRYFREMATAVAGFHDLPEPVAHGDLKPDNILVDTTGTIRILDFGCARQVSAETGMTAELQGALEYTAPETLIGQGGEHSDLYSIGLIMYELLTGDGPHLHIPECTGIESGGHYYREKSRLRFPPLAESCPSLDPDPQLFEIVERCCSFEFRERHPSVRAMLADLDAPAEEAADRAARPPEATWAKRVAERHRGGDFEGGYEILDSLGGAGGPEVTGWRVVFLAGLERCREALDLGGIWYETVRSDPGIPRELLRRVRHALLHSAREAGSPHETAYYARLVADEGTS